jgi:hypothetical protein
MTTDTDGLLKAKDGNFYGTTFSDRGDGSSGFGYGTVFKTGRNGVRTTLIVFNRTNGANPLNQLVQGKDGNIYGITTSGGAFGQGTVFRLNLTRALSPAPTNVNVSILIHAVSNKVDPRIMDAMQAPIDFYGEVVDEKSNAVSNAGVSFHWTDLTAKGFNNSSTAQSDSNGLFSLTGKQGGSLTVSVGKNGYYAFDRWGKTFFYSKMDAGRKHIPDPLNPVIFYLRKKGTPEPLIHIAGIGLHTMRDFLFTADGRPTEVSLRDGRLTPAGQGDLKVEFQAGLPLDNFPSRISWQCQVSVPGGGLVQTSEEFPFLAPENDYQEFDQWSITSTNWTETLDKQYYLKLRDGNFGRVKLRVIGVPNRAYFRMESFLNPSGSRNLEPTD